MDRSARPPAKPDDVAEARLSIGAFSRAAGIPVETLRTWENRYGFPRPERKPSGHRVYPVSSLPRLHLIAEALRRGHRAGQVVPSSDAELQQLLGAQPAPPAPSRGAPSCIDDLLARVADFDREALTRGLLADWARLGAIGFLTGRVAPLVRAVGDAWKEGALTITHEHFLSERVGDLLRVLRQPLEERASGPLVVLATLPGERHGLGLQMAALAFAQGGCRLLVLGTETPATEIVSLARTRRAGAVGISVSEATKGRRSAGLLRRLREQLPVHVLLAVGGDGAPRSLPGVTVWDDLAAVEQWARAASVR